MEYNEADEIRAYIWFNANHIIPTEYWIYKKERALNKRHVTGIDGGKPRLNIPCDKSLLSQLSVLLDDIDESKLDESMEHLVISGTWGTLNINRCYNCGRVLKTRESKQCLWCNSDWH